MSPRGGAGVGGGGVPAISTDAFHRYLWKKANRVGKVVFRNDELGEEMGLSRFTISRIMAKLMAEKRAFKMSRGGLRQGNTYQLIDPDVWAAGS